MLPLLFLLSILSNSVVVSAGDPFWISADVLRVDWREGCLTTAGCSQPRFKILEDMLRTNEKVSISWSVSEHLVQESRPFVSHWPSGSASDISLSCQVVGVDPTYGFPRICDQTSAVRLFQDEHREVHPKDLQTLLSEEDRGKIVVEVRGKCFNASLGLMKHTDRCPWCPDPSDVTLIGQEVADYPTLSSSILSQLQGDDRLIHIGFLVLAVIAVVASAAFGCLLVSYLKQKRTHKQLVVKPRYHPYASAMLKADDDNRYDMPWEQQRPLTYWMSSKSSDGTTTSPIDSASSFNGVYNYRNGNGTLVAAPHQTRISQSIYHHIGSPNSNSIGRHQHHDDSGLESV